MHDHIPEVHDQPAFTGPSFDAAFFLVIQLCGFQYTFGEGVEHAVTGTVTDDKIIGKGCNVFDVEKEDVFAFFILQGFDDFMGKVECVQISPLGM